MVNARTFIWLTPFACAIAGYQLCFLLFSTNHVTTPDIVGTTLHNAAVALAQRELNPRILRQVEDASLPEGTVLKQAPAAGETVRPHQPVFLVITTQPPPKRAPSTHGSTHDHIVARCREQHIRCRVHPVASNQPAGTCIAQSPAPDVALGKEPLLIYASAPQPEHVLLPDFVGKNLHEVIEFLEPYGIAVTIEGTMPAKHHLRIVTEQKPLAHSLINLAQAPSVHLRVQNR